MLENFLLQIICFPPDPGAATLRKRGQTLISDRVMEGHSRLSFISGTRALILEDALMPNFLTADDNLSL